MTPRMRIWCRLWMETRMSDRELRSWSAGDPEPPEDVTLLRYERRSLPYAYLRRSGLTDLVGPGSWVLEASADQSKWRPRAGRPWVRCAQQTNYWGLLVEVLPETPTPDPNKIYAPWDVKTALALNDFQQRREMHPFTCPREHEPEGERVLVANNGGWFCPDDDYTQNWAHAFMADPAGREPVPAVQDDASDRGCCTACDGTGSARPIGEPCSDCYATGHDHDGPCLPAAPVSVVQDDTPADNRSDSCVQHDVYVERLRVAVGGSLSQGPEDYISEAEQICAEHRGGTEVNGQPFPAVVGTEALGARLVRIANDVLGNDPKNVLDCSTAHMIATVLRELAAAEDDKPPRNPLTSGVLRASLRQLADEIEGTQG